MADTLFNLSFQSFGLPVQAALLFKSLLGNDEHSPYEKILNLPTSLIPTAANFTKLLNKYMTMDANNFMTFDWDNFSGSASFTEGLEVINVTKDKNFTLEEYRTVEALADEVVRYLKDTFSAEVPGIKEEIVNVMTNLKECKAGGFASFYESEDKKSSGFQFNAMFASQKSGVNDHFFSLATTIKVEAEQKTESWWWGLKKEYTEKFSCNLNAMEVMIGNDFGFK